MALISCPECNKEISDKAINCPNCGYPISGGASNNEPSAATGDINCPKCGSTQLNFQKPDAFQATHAGSVLGGGFGAIIGRIAADMERNVTVICKKCGYMDDLASIKNFITREREKKERVDKKNADKSSENVSSLTVIIVFALTLGFFVYYFS